MASRAADTLGGADEKQISGGRPTTVAMSEGVRPFYASRNRFGADIHRLSPRKASLFAIAKLYPEAGRGNDHRRKFSTTWANTR